MQSLTEEQKKRVISRMKALSLKRPDLAKRLSISLNTIGTALKGKGVHENTAQRLIAFAFGADVIDAESALPSATQDQIGAYARAANVTPAEWIEAMMDWLQKSPARVRQMVTESVSDELVVKRLEGRGVRRGSSPPAGASGRDRIGSDTRASTY